MALTDACPSCGAANEAAARFCGECGTALHPAAGARRAPLAERRVVSVMFADLVGFSRLTAENDAEEVREWLSRYFAAAQRLVDLYGGVIEKFIGDAVVAIWGAPLANEDDAERAVRTALDLVTAVGALAEELDRPELRIRVGVLTGEAVVTVGAESEGMIAGDAVNMASRIQTVAAPGTVWVGESTRRASAASIAYEDVGLHAVKGRDEPLRLYRATHVTAARRGERRSLGLEPPFAGRTREFRGVTDVFHASIEDRRARIVTVTGIAGVGKSRLSWEFEKHVDGLALEVAWHHGRCLAYGQGVAFAALAEMVRSRARISEETPTTEAVARLGAMLDDISVTPDEREFLEPRLAHLLGLTDRRAPDREDLFSAWRLFFERLADDRPVALVFDDLQWADDVLLDFIEYLLDWSRDYPIFILALARPELLERRPALGAGRDHTTLALEPLADGAMDELLDGLVPGLPADLRGRIVERSEGVPLYAVETVRMLLTEVWSSRPATRIRPSARSKRSTCRRPCTRSWRRGSTASSRPSGDCSRMRPCLARRSRDRAWWRSRALPTSRLSRSCARSCERKRSRCRATRSHPTADSCRSSRICCGWWRTRRCRCASASSAIWRPPRTLRSGRATTR